MYELTIMYLQFWFIGGAAEEDGEPDKMFIAFDRIGRFKRWVIGGIVGFFRGIKNGIVRAIRGPRGGNGSGSAGADIIALEVTDEKDFQVRNTYTCFDFLYSKFGAL